MSVPDDDPAALALTAVTGLVDDAIMVSHLLGPVEIDPQDACPTDACDNKRLALRRSCLYLSTCWCKSLNGIPESSRGIVDRKAVRHFH